MAKRPILSFPPDFGRYLAVVFEFLGFLGLGGVAGYVAATVWPEQGSWMFPSIFLAMFLLGLWFMIRQTASLAKQQKKREKEQREEASKEQELTPDSVEKRMREFDERFNRALKGRGRRRGGSP